MGSKAPSQPTPPPAPSVADTTKAYVESLPAMYQAQLDWNPKLTEQDFQLTSQYAQKYKSLQDSLYPELAQLDKNLTNQAVSGSATSALSPDQMKMYQDQFRAEAGDQVGSGIGADYVSRGVLGMGMQQQQYYQNLGLTLTGRQPLYQAQQTQTANVGQGYNYSTISGAMQQGYGNYSNAYSSMYGANAQLQGSRNQMYGQMVGGAAGGIGTYFGLKH